MPNATTPRSSQGGLVYDVDPEIWLQAGASWWVMGTQSPMTRPSAFDIGITQVL